MPPKSPKPLNPKLKLMFHLSISAVISLTTGCQPSISNPQQFQSHFERSPHKKLTSTTEIIPQSIPQSILLTKLHQIKHEGIQFNLVTFDTRNQQLVVADQPNGPGSIWADAAAAAKAHNGIAAINGGFFTPEGKPLGIVISNGKELGSFNQSSLGSGLFYHTPIGAGIARKSAWDNLKKNPPAHLLQSGPMLLENSKSITGLSNKNSRPRSFIATDGKNHWCIGHADPCSLSQLSEALASISISEFRASKALNLDGGRSSDLWVSASVNGEPKVIRPFWNKPVRNFLILKSN
ncbi:MAG: phosphodiester glycosidase family protein [Rubritalea sp.]